MEGKNIENTICSQGELKIERLKRKRSFWTNNVFAMNFQMWKCRDAHFYDPEEAILHSIN